MDFSDIDLQETGCVINDKIIFDMLLDKINLPLYRKAITLDKSDDFVPLNDPYKDEQDILKMIFQDNVSVSLFNRLTETIVIHTAVSVNDTKVICPFNICEIPESATNAVYRFQSLCDGILNNKLIILNDTGYIRIPIIKLRFPKSYEKFEYLVKFLKGALELIKKNPHYQIINFIVDAYSYSEYALIFERLQHVAHYYHPRLSGLYNYLVCAKAHLKNKYYYGFQQHRIK